MVITHPLHGQKRPMGLEAVSHYGQKRPLEQVTHQHYGQKRLIEPEITPSSDEESSSDSDESCSSGSGSPGNSAGWSLSSRSLSVCVPPPEKRQHLCNDLKSISPVPIYSYIKKNICPKACGRCDECKKPPCGTCKTCISNLVSSKVKKRCKNLTCVRFINMETPEKPTMTRDQIKKELTDITCSIAEKGGAMPEEELVQLQKRAGDLRSYLQKTLKRDRVPPGFFDVWNIVSDLEKRRAAIAKWIAKSPGSNPSVVDDKRDIRDTLEKMIIQLCERFSNSLDPIKDPTSYFEVLKSPRL